MFENPILFWFIIGLVLLVSELLLPGFIIVFFGIGAWIAAGTLPVVTLLPSLTSSMNDRLMYLSGVGYAPVIGGWLAGGGVRRHVVVAGLVASTTLQTVSLSGAWARAGEATRVLVEQTASIARTLPHGTPQNSGFRVQS